MAALIPEFKKRNVVAAAVSCDPVESHKAWIKDIQVRAAVSVRLASAGSVSTVKTEFYQKSMKSVDPIQY